MNSKNVYMKGKWFILMKNEEKIVNWLSYIHTEHLFTSLMGEQNYKCFQLGMSYLTALLEQRYMEDEKFIIFFVAGGFRMVNKYVLLGGLSHYAKKANERTEDVIRMAIKATEASFKTQSPPQIKYIPPTKITLNSWQNRFQELAIDLFLHPEKYPKGLKIDPEQAVYSGPIVKVAIQTYLQILENAVRYAKKRMVVKRMQEIEQEIREEVEKLTEKTNVLFNEAKAHMQETLSMLREIEGLINSKIDRLKGLSLSYERMRGKIAEKHDQTLEELEEFLETYNKIVETQERIDEARKEARSRKEYKKSMKKILQELDRGFEEEKQSEIK